MTSVDLLEKVITAHGGRERWRTINSIEATFSSGGLAFSLHMQPLALRGLQITLQPHARRVTLLNFCHPGWRGVWTPTAVQILDENDRVVSARDNPRAGFSRLDKLVRWDKLDILYFAGYALWNYLSFPFILELPGVTLAESRAVPDKSSGAQFDRLTACFDDEIPTHSRDQAFLVDDTGLLLRHDYTADVIGGWAKAANFCQASEVVDGVRFYTRRRVYPRIGAESVLPFPTLVWIELGAIRLA